MPRDITERSRVDTGTPKYTTYHWTTTGRSEAAGIARTLQGGTIIDCDIVSRLTGAWRAAGVEEAGGGGGERVVWSDERTAIRSRCALQAARARASECWAGGVQ